MLNEYLSWPLQIEQAIASWGSISIHGNFEEIAVIGMGGSGIVGDFLQTLSIRECPIPVYVIKSHLVPAFVDDRSLAIVVSYSGETLETLLAFKKVIERKAHVVTVSSGGKLREIAKRHGIHHIQVPKGLLPRASLPSMLYSILGLLDSSGYSIVTKDDATRSLEFLRGSLADALSVSASIAKWIYESVVAEGRLLIIATHTPLEALANRGKNEFCENSKLATKVDIAPDWMHNDIVGYESPITSKFGVLEIFDSEDHVGRKLIEFMELIYRDLGSRIYRLDLKGGGVLEKIIYGSLVLGLASVQLAELRKLDPTITKSINLYKERATEIYKV